VKIAANLRDQAMAKKQVYLDAVIKSARQTRSRLAVPDSSEIPVGDFRKDMIEQQQRVLTEESRIEESLRRVAPSEESLMMRRQLEAELASLIDVQDSIATRIRSLDGVDRAQQAIRASAREETEAQILNGLLEVWDRDRAATAAQRDAWAKLYASMERVLDGRLTDQKPTPAVSVPLTGTWIYRSRPGDWKGFGEPKNVNLELHGDGANLRGTYTAVLPVKGGAHSVRLSLAGPAAAGNAAHLHWTSQDPAASGEMDLRLAPDGRLSVERVKSGDSFIPAGMEILSLAAR
jgi:hypothetical protein